MKVKKLAFALLSMAMAAALVFTGCSSPSSSTAAPSTGSPSTAAPAGEPAANTGEPIRLALVAPLTGADAQYGQQFKRGVEIFVEEYNAAGGYNGAELQVDVYDDKNDAKEAVNIANLIISDGGYMCVIGPFSSTCAFAMGEVLDEEGILTISPSVSHPDYVTDFDYTFRVAHVNSQEGAFVAKYCAQEWGTQKVSGIYTNNDWGLTVSEAFADTCKDEGIEVVTMDNFIVGQTKDFSPMITRAKEAGADTIYIMANYTEAGQMLRQIKDMGLDVKVFVSVIAYKVETLDIAGDAADDALFGTTFDVNNPDPIIQNFRATVREKYDVEIDNMIVRAYDAVKVAMMALENSGGNMDADALKAEIMQLKDIHGVSGIFSFVEDRNITRQFSIAVPDGEGSFEFYLTPDLG